MTEADDRSLREIYQQVRILRNQLIEHDSRSSAYKDLLVSLTRDLEQCQRLISDLSIFSPNEDLEDLSTQNLQYLTIDFLLADLLQRSYDGGRLAALRRVSSLLDSFLTRLDQYSILSSDDRKLYERCRDAGSSFSLLPTNMEDRRRVKIKRFQEEKELKRQLEVWLKPILTFTQTDKILQHLRSMSSSARTDDETIRKLYLAEIASFTHDAFQALDSVSQETAILALMQQNQPGPMVNPQSDSRDQARSTDGYSERLDTNTTMAGLGRRGGPLLDPKGKPLQPFTLLDKRSQMRDGVFRPGHSLPTMSIDEYLEEERRRGGIIEGGGNANDVAPEPDEDNMDEVDAATIKAREWDEFVEANPKGAGNTLNRG